MKTTFNFANIFIQNEGKIASLIGNIMGILGIIAGIPAAAAASGITSLPPIVIKISAIASSLFFIGKYVTKMTGTVDNSGQPVNTQLPSTIGITDGNRVKANP